MTPEGEVLAQVKKYLSASGIFFFRCNTGRRGGVSFGIKGAPDIVGVLPGGRFLAVEVKAPDGRLSPAQVDFLGEVEKQGGAAIVAHSLQEIEAGLAKYI